MQQRPSQSSHPPISNVKKVAVASIIVLCLSSVLVSFSSPSSASKNSAVVVVKPSSAPSSIIQSEQQHVPVHVSTTIKDSNNNNILNQDQTPAHHLTHQKRRSPLARRPVYHRQAIVGARHVAEHGASDMASLAMNPFNHFSQLCHLSTENKYDGGCKPNPWYKPGRKHRASAAAVHDPKKQQLKTTVIGGGGFSEMQCPLRKSERWKLSSSHHQKREPKVLVVMDGSSPPATKNNAYDGNEGKQNKEEEEEEAQLREFKRQTSWMFEKWYDWKAKCAVDDDSDDGESVGGADTGGSPTRKTLPRKKKNDGILRSGMTSRDHLTELENFCVNPIGRLWGYWPGGAKVGGGNTGFPPQLNPWQGTHEAFHVNGGSKRVEEGMNAMWNGFKKLKKKPSCFLDTNLIIFPITIFSRNAGHAFHRAASMLRTIEAVIQEINKEKRSRVGANRTTSNSDADEPLLTPSDITVMYLVTPHGTKYVHTPEANANQNPQRFFYDALGTSWFSVLGQDESGPAFRKAWANFFSPPPLSPASTTFSPAPFLDNKNRSNSSSSSSSLSPNENNSKNPQQQQQPMACFRRAFVWSNALRFDMMREFNPNAGRTLAADANRAGHRTAYHLFGARSMRDVDTLNLINNKLRSCPAPALPPRRSRANTKNPHVIFSGRSIYRRFSLHPHLVNVVADYVTKELNGTLEVVEHVALDYDEVIEKFSKADVLIAIHGASLVWLQFMPPGSVVVESNVPMYRCSDVPGINRSPGCDFGGAAMAAQQWHINIANNFDPMMRLPQWIEQRRRYGASHTDIGGGGIYMRWILEKVKCVLENGVLNPKVTQQGVPSQCQFTGKELLKVSKKDVYDEETGGENLAAFAQMNLPSLSAVAAGGVPLLVASSSSSGMENTTTTAKRVLGDDDDEPTARLKLMIKNSERVSIFIKPFRESGTRSTYFRMLFLVRCSARSLGDSLLAEINAWRGILRDVYFVTVAQYYSENDDDGGSSSSSSGNSSSCPQSLIDDDDGSFSFRKDIYWHGIRVCNYRDCTKPHIVVGGAHGDFASFSGISFSGISTLAEQRHQYHIVVRSRVKRATTTASTSSSASIKKQNRSSRRKMNNDDDDSNESRQQQQGGEEDSVDHSSSSAKVLLQKFVKAGSGRLLTFDTASETVSMIAN